jgi:hypothetical protein
MTFDLVSFLSAVALLWLPLPVSSGRRAGDPMPVPLPSLPNIFRAWQNWIDLIRSASATYALLYLSIKVDTTSPEAVANVFYLQVGILAVGVLFQCVRFIPELGLGAPVFYLSGLSLMLPGYVEGSFAVAVAWALATGAKDPRVVLPALSGLLILTGFCWRGLVTWHWVTALLVIIPVALALLWCRRLNFVAYNRRPSRSRPRKKSVRPAAVKAAAVGAE